MLRNILHAGAALVGLVLVLGGCKNDGSSVALTSEYGPGVKFSETAHTYAWTKESARTSGEGRPLNPSADKLIREFTETHLARKGYTKAAGAPDFLVDYSVSRGKRADPNDFTKPLQPEGTLEIIVTSPQTGKLIWKGSGQTLLDPSMPPDQVRQRLDQIVGQILDQIPSARMK